MQGCAMNSDRAPARWGLWLIGAMLVVAAGVLGNAVILRAGAELWLAFSVLFGAMLIAAVILALGARTGWGFLVGTAILLACMIVPLAWTPDPARWLKVNPAMTWMVGLLAVTAWRNRSTATTLVAAVLFGLINVGTSLLLGR